MTIGGAAAGGDRAGSSSGGSRGGSKVIMHSDGSFYFEIDSTPGETTVVSWKKLLRDHADEIAAGASSTSRPNAMAPPATPNPSPDMSIVPALGPAVQPPSSSFNSVFEKIERLYVKGSSDEEDLNDVVMGDDNYDTDDSFIDDSDLDEYFRVESSATKYDGYFVHRGKLEGVEPSMVQDEQSKKRREEDVAEGSDGDQSKKPRKAQQLGIKSPRAGGVADTFSNLDEQEMKRQKRKQSNRESARRSRMRKQEAEKMKRTDSEVQPVCDQQQLKLVPDPSDRRIILRIPLIPKNAGLENAIKDLEKLVTETRPPSVVGQAGSSSQPIRRRLPQEIRKELAKVAGHAQASDGKIKKDLVDRLVPILGHLVNRNTLKRNLKTIVDAELAKHGKDDMVQLVKPEAPEEQAGASSPPRS